MLYQTSTSILPRTWSCSALMSCEVVSSLPARSTWSPPPKVLTSDSALAHEPVVICSQAFLLPGLEQEGPSWCSMTVWWMEERQVSLLKNLNWPVALSYCLWCVYSWPQPQVLLYFLCNLFNCLFFLPGQACLSVSPSTTSRWNIVCKYWLILIAKNQWLAT